MSVQQAVEQFMERVRMVLAPAGATEDALREIGGMLQALAQTPDLIPDDLGATMHQSDATSTTLHSDGTHGLTLILARFPATAATPIHDHNSWGVACVVSGRDRYQHFERLDDGTDPHHAQLRLLYERELAPGDVVIWTNPPHDIHRQQGVNGPAWELVLFGVNAMALPRRYFDIATGAVRESLPQ
jgi:predicted metal-dependent enzyme (double-stranded beta helix superfamily)